MPIAKIRGIHLNYEILGDEGPWIALSPGGRRGVEGIKTIAQNLSAKGYRILIFDRRNCGASDIGITGGSSETEEWADDLYQLTSQLGIQPCIVGGGSSGCRTAVVYAIRHAKAVSGLLIWRITGGAYAALSLGVEYYSEYIKEAGLGGMAAICKTEFFSERIRENPRNLEILMQMDPTFFVEIMVRWMCAFVSDANETMIGASADQLGNIKVPVLMFCGNDRHHAPEACIGMSKILADRELVDLGMPLFDADAAPPELWEEQVPFMVDKCHEFIQRRIIVV